MHCCWNCTVVDDIVVVELLVVLEWDDCLVVGCIRIYRGEAARRIEEWRRMVYYYYFDTQYKVFTQI